MPVVPEDVVTNEQTAVPAVETAPEPVAQAVPPAPETNGTAPAACRRLLPRRLQPLPPLPWQPLLRLLPRVRKSR